MPRIAISYRRADTAAITGRIFDRLVQHYGAGSVFMDIDEIPFGIDFRHHVDDVLSNCDAVVVVIGQRWLGMEGDRRRIDEESDPVRVEVQAALDRRTIVIPVLADGAAMPGSSDLPEPIQDLAFRNACPVDTGRDFHAHVDRLIRSMDRMFGDAAATSPSGSASTRQAAQSSIPSASAPSPAAPPATAEASSLRPGAIALIVLFLALPHILQFWQRKELFIAGLIVSVVGAAALLDRPDRSMVARIASGILTVAGLVIVQAGIGLARASFLE